MSKQRPQTVALEDLAKVAGQKFGFDLGILDLSRIRGIDEIRADSEADVARVARKAEAVLKFVTGLPKAVRDILGIIEEMPGSATAVQHREMLDAKIFGVTVPDDTETTENLRGHARWQYATAVMERALSDGSAVRCGDVLKDFVARGILREAEPGRPTGPIRHKDRDTMYLPGSYPRELKQLVQDTFSGLATLQERSQAQWAEDRDSRREEFRAGANLSWGDLLGGVPGIFVLFSPTEDTGEIVKDRDTGQPVRDRRTGEPFTRKYWGGEFKVVSDGKVVRLVATNGIKPFTNAMGDAVTHRVAVPIVDIKAERMGRLDPSVFQNPAKKGATYRLHGLLRRGYVQHMEFEEKKAAADASKAQTTVDFGTFLLDGVSGITHIQHRQFTDKKSEVVYRYPWVRIERTMGEGGSMIRLVESNEPNLFADIGKEPRLEGNEFAGLAKPLDIFLRLARNGAERKRAAGTEAGEQEATRKWVEGLKAGNGDHHVVDGEAAGPEQ